MDQHLACPRAWVQLVRFGASLLGAALAAWCVPLLLSSSVRAAVCYVRWPKDATDATWGLVWWAIALALLLFALLYRRPAASGTVEFTGGGMLVLVGLFAFALATIFGPSRAQPDPECSITPAGTAAIGMLALLPLIGIATTLAFARAPRLSLTARIMGPALTHVGTATMFLLLVRPYDLPLIPA